VFFNVPSLLIVLGGTIATTFIRFPMPMVLGTVNVIKNAFLERSAPVDEMIRKIVELSELARRESVLALDNVEIEDPFLRKGVQLAVDGTDPALIRQILNTELVAILDRHKLGNKIFRGMGDSAPAFGMIGTLIGLVQMLMAMDDPKSIGPAMAVALLTTMYGAIIANVVCIPIADKLAYRTQNEKLLKQVCIQGIYGIMAGTHPRVIEEKLLTFLAPASRDHARKAA
jgi:chemotaxis protein MotA